MAGRKFSAVVTDEAFSAAATETVVQVVAGTNHAFKVLGWGIAFAGTGVTDEPIRIELLRQTTAGTSSALTIVDWQPTADTLDSSALDSFTVEPTAGDILSATRTHPQAGYEIWYPEGKEPESAAAGRIGIRIITPTGVNPNASAYMVCEE